MRKGLVVAAVSAAVITAGGAYAADLTPMTAKAAVASTCVSFLDFYTTACQLRGVRYGTAPGESPNFLFDFSYMGADLGKALASYGVYLHATTQQSDVSVLAGGHDKRSQYLSVSFFGFSVDTEKAFGLQGGFFDFTASGQLGNTLTGSDSVGSNGFVPYGFSKSFAWSISITTRASSIMLLMLRSAGCRPGIRRLLIHPVSIRRNGSAPFSAGRAAVPMLSPTTRAKRHMRSDHGPSR